jgi:hypothetical protein
MLGTLAQLASSGPAELSAWQEACYALWVDKLPDTRRKVFSKNRRTLAIDGLIKIDGEAVTVTVTGKSMVTDKVTPDLEPVTVTVTSPPSIEGDGGDVRTTRTGPLFHADGSVGGNEIRPRKVMDERPTGLSRGAGVNDPAMTHRRGDGDDDDLQADKEKRDAA